MPNKLILLHGFTGSPASWDAVRDLLPHSIRILCPPLTGHAPEAGPSVDFVAEVDRLAGVIHAAGMAGSHLCGYSLGGRVVMGLLVRHRSLFTGATLVSAHPGLPEQSPERADRSALDERWAVLAESSATAEFFAKWSSQPLFSSQQALSPDVRARQEAIRKAHDGPALAAAMRTLSLARMPDWRPALTTLTLPVQIFVGGDDRKFTAIAHDLVSLMPNATVTSIPGAGHNLILECPDQLASALLSTGD